MNQLGQLVRDHAIYEEKGAKILAVAVQDLTGAATTVDRLGAEFPILADKDHAVADAYGIYDLYPDACGPDKATSSVFLINKDGRIVWEYISTSTYDRVPSETILENLPG